MTKRRADQSQLDYLWEMFGDLSLCSNPFDAENGDILNKEGITSLIVSLIKHLIKDIRLVDSKLDEKLYDVVATTENGKDKFLFNLEKENHIVKIILRKSLEPDVEDGIAEDVGEPLLDFEMKNSEHLCVSLGDIYLQGGLSASINNWVERGKIYSQLRLANSDDPTLNIDIIQNGLLIETILSQQNGQVVLEKSTTGLNVRFEWADGKPIQIKDMSWAKYSLDENKDGVIYFLNDKGYILLNGKRYGETPNDVIRMKASPIEGNKERMVLELKQDDAIISGTATLIKGTKNGATVIGDSNHPVHIFGSEKLKYNGIELALSSDLTKEISDVEGLITNLETSVTERTNELSEAITTSVDAEAERINGIVLALNTNLENKIKRVNDTSVKVTDISTSDNPGRKAIVLENNDMILGTSINGDTYNLAMVNKWGVADYGSGNLPFNINVPAGERPTVQEKGMSGEQAHHLAYQSDVDNLKQIINILQDEIVVLKQQVDSLVNPQP